MADTNVIVAAILRRGLTRNLIFSAGLQLISPDFAYQEIKNHEEEYLKKSGLEHKAFERSVEIVLSRITPIPEEEYGGQQATAKEFSPDLADWPFFALSLVKKCPLWSNDRVLKKQNRVQVISTPELLEMLG
ncbi:MAG: PIN domain-containing protein [Candidatus Micrarchaeota archaeon]